MRLLHAALFWKHKDYGRQLRRGFFCLSTGGCFDPQIIVCTSGGCLTYQHATKPVKAFHCAGCKRVLRGIKPARPCELYRMSKRLKTVNRAHGG
ncbi:60S ribosomal protein L34 [Hyalella azteca]|uniref:Large ribosomal subunit protein eL34 n=1 Tax=Hyalella azteca TaxID=294128 RepID=A0A8B7P2S5_HYAAZ|nr:60S ribosomal protein L34 [Hyalella azteca]